MPAIMPTDSPGGREGEGLAEAELLGKVEETQQHMGGFLSGETFCLVHRTLKTSHFPCHSTFPDLLDKKAALATWGLLKKQGLLPKLLLLLPTPNRAPTPPSSCTAPSSPPA